MIKTKMASLAPSRQKFKQEISLVSGGYANRTAFPGGKITVYPWDTSTDRWLTDKGRGATSIYDLVGQLADLNGCPIDEFVLGDVTTVLLVARAIAKQNVVEVYPVCPHCKEKQPADRLKVPDELERVGEKTGDYPGYDKITLPVCQDEVKIRPLVVGDEKLIIGRDELQRTDLPDFLARVLTAVVAVNDTTPDTLTELVAWWNALHPGDQAFVQTSQDQLYPHLNSDLPYTCDSCGKAFKHVLSFNQDFFR